MRLWHNALIETLPRKQLLGQWRELNSIFKLNTKHILINFVYSYPLEDLYCYSVNIIREMRIRGYTVNTANFETYFSGYRVLYDENFIPFKEKMNDTYLKICIANLYEKYLCGGISDAEWQKIYDSNIFIIESMNL